MLNEVLGIKRFYIANFEPFRPAKEAILYKNTNLYYANPFFFVNFLSRCQFVNRFTILETEKAKGTLVKRNEKIKF